MTSSSPVLSSAPSAVPERRLEGASVVVTGAAGGIGAATCARLCAEGARVTAVDQDRGRLDALRASLATAGALEVLTGDATDAETAGAAVELARTSFGRLDGVVSIAGASGRQAGDGPVHECTPEGWAWTLETNLTSQFLMARAALPQLIAGGGGSIVLLGSVLG